MMKKHLRIWIPILLLSFAAFACKEKPDLAWADACTKDTPDAYRAYIASHPQSQYLKMASYQLERLVYHQAMAQNTASSYAAYLREFPNGQWALNAHQSRLALTAQQLRHITNEQLAAARVRFETDRGAFTVRVFPDKAPATSRNYLALVASGFYDGLWIHYIQPKQLVQTGDPRGDSLGGPGYFIPFEKTGLTNIRGALVMWHTPVDPNTAGSQFFIDLADMHQLDGKFAVFGEVVDGLDKLDEISQVDSTGSRGFPPFQPRKRISITRTVLEGIEIK